MAVKRIICTALCVSLTACMTLQSVNSAWKHIGFDTSNINPTTGSGVVGETFGEYVNGQRVRTDVRPTNHTWITGGYEAAYPHAEYNRLYAYNSDTASYEALDVVRHTGKVAPWETRDVAYDWDYLDIIENNKQCVVCKNDSCSHIGKYFSRVWTRQQTNVPGKGWSFDYGNRKLQISDSVVHKTNTDDKARNVEVKPYYKTAFVGNVSVLTGRVFAQQDNPMLVKAYNELIGGKWIDSNLLKIGAGDELGVINLSKRNPTTGRYLVSDEYIASKIYVVKTKYVEGPAFDNDGNLNGTRTIDLSKEYLNNYRMISENRWNPSFDAIFDYDTNAYLSSVKNAGIVVYQPADVSEISWTEPTKDPSAPLRNVQFLKVSGIALDGKDGKPVVMRFAFWQN